MRTEYPQQPDIATAPGTIVLSVCVIGRNEARNLPRLLESLRPLRQLAPIETLFIDSASEDDSVSTAKTGFDRVVSLRRSPQLNASAARNLATTLARGTWVLYLDGDMALREEFIPVLREWLARRAANQGIVGICWHQYPDGHTREMLIRGNREGSPCQGFGGAVILPRESVLAAGNWNPNLNAYEEIELYGRLRALGCVVCYRRVAFVDHYTARLSRLRLLAGSFVPFGSILGKKYYGAGQAVAASLRGHTLSAFLRVKAAPFVFIGGLLATAIALLSGTESLAAIVLIATLAVAIRAGGSFGPVIYLSWIPQIALGVFKYRDSFAPQIAEDWRSSAGRPYT
jgi:glycosyltransferase involved in cell wall biosynthesis